MIDARFGKSAEHMFPLSRLLNRFIRNGSLRVFDAEGTVHRFGNGEAPSVTMRLHQPSLYRKLFLNPELYLGEAYMDGSLTFEECGVRDFHHLFSINRLQLGKHPVQKALRKFWRLTRRLQQSNPEGKARRNVAHHYDLSRTLYELFLDSDMQYSCGYFLSPQDSLEQAQLQKKRHLAAKLALAPGQRLLDIGCGWGGLGLYLASVADVEVVGVTLSREQHAVAVERAAALGLTDRVRFELRDYRSLEQKFDRIVSVGMFEHVGVARYDEFFAKVFGLLEDDGVAVLHSIGHMSPPGTASPWLRKYIFPHAYSPAMSEVFAATERQRLWVTDVEVLRIHYADTIREWHRRFEANRAQIADLYDERFCRMWEFYLTGVEMMFRHGSQMVFQMQLGHRPDAVPLTRDYMLAAEHALADGDEKG